MHNKRYKKKRICIGKHTSREHKNLSKSNQFNSFKKIANKGSVIDALGLEPFTMFVQVMLENRVLHGKPRFRCFIANNEPSLISINERSWEGCCNVQTKIRNTQRLTMVKRVQGINTKPPTHFFTEKGSSFPGYKNCRVARSC